MEDMLKDFMLGEHLLLVGNQVRHATDKASHLKEKIPSTWQSSSVYRVFLFSAFHYYTYHREGKYI